MTPTQNKRKASCQTFLDFFEFSFEIIFMMCKNNGGKRKECSFDSALKFTFMCLITFMLVLNLLLELKTYVQ